MLLRSCSTHQVHGLSKGRNDGIKHENFCWCQSNSYINFLRERFPKVCNHLSPEMQMSVITCCSQKKQYTEGHRQFSSTSSSLTVHVSQCFKNYFTHITNKCRVLVLRSWTKNSYLINLKNITLSQMAHQLLSETAALLPACNAQLVGINTESVPLSITCNTSNTGNCTHCM